MNDTVSPTPKAPRSRSTIFGVTAGVIAGGAIGLVAAVPSLTSATSDDSVDDVVALQDDTETDTTDTDNDTTEARPEPGERLREVLQPLVDDGTIDASQADAVADHLAESRPERGERGDRAGHRGGREGRHGNGAAVAELLGIDQETLRAELEAGKSIADIAEANDVDVQGVIDALIADAESHIEMATEHGLDEERAAARLESITERITEAVNKTRPTDG